MMIFNNKMKPLWIAILSLLLISACTVVPQRTAVDPHAKVADIDQGTLIVTLTNNTKMVNYWHSMEVYHIRDQYGQTPKDIPGVGDSRTFTLQTNTETGSSYTALYMGHLPAGEYRLKKITHSDGTWRRWVEFKNRDAIFYIQPGGLTDLGRMVVTEIGAGKTIMEPKVALARSSIVKSNLDYLAYIDSPLQKRYEQGTVLGWHEPEISEPEEMVEKIARYYASGHYGLHTHKSGLAFVGSRMGQIWSNLKINKGKWVNIDTKTINSIYALEFTDEGKLIVGGELGYLAVFEKEKGFVEIDKRDLPIGDVVFVSNKNGRYRIGISKGDQLMFFRTADLMNPTWEKFGEVRAKFNLWSIPNTFSQVETVGDHIVVASTPKRLYVYYPDTNQWIERKLPKTVSHFEVNLDKRLVMQGIPFKTNFYSDDLGKTWHEMETVMHDGMAQFLDNDTAYVLGVKDPGVFTSGAPVLKSSKDYGKTWAFSGKEAVGGRALHVSIDEKTLYMTNDYYLEYTRDGGKSYWLARTSRVPDFSKKAE